jgi:hypothetical protein
MSLSGDTAAPRNPVRAAPPIVPMMPCVGAIDSAVLAYPAASAGQGTRPRRRLGGLHTCLGTPSDVAMNRQGDLYVLSRGPYDQRGGWTNAVAVFAAEDSGDAVPRRRILVPPSFNNPALGMGIDSAGNLYVTTEEYPPALETPPPAHRFGGAVRVYAAGADSAARPIRILAGDATQLFQPADVGFDRRGDMYVVNTSSGRLEPGYVTVYDADAQGDVAPRRTIAGPHTEFHLPMKLALGAGDTLYVLNAYNWNRFGTDQVTVTVYPPGASGDIAPARTLVVKRGPGSEGARRGLGDPYALAVDNQGFIYIAMSGGWSDGAVAVYPPGAAGDVAPTRLLGGSGTGLRVPRGLVLNDRGELYVTSVPAPGGM